MARQMAPTYTPGKISYSDHPTMAGMKQATALYRDRHQRRREVTGSGKTDAAARRALYARLKELSERHEGGDAVVSHKSTVSETAQAWHDQKTRERLSENTLGQYASTIRNHIDGRSVADQKIGDFNTVGCLTAWLQEVADESGEGAASQAYKVAKGVLEMAEEREAIPASVMHRVKRQKAKAGTKGDNRCTDDECDLDCGKRHLDTRRAFTEAEAAKVLEQADKSTADVGDLCHFLYATGVRISEAVLHVEWADLDTKAGKVRVRGTKTANADRVLPLPEWLCARLEARGETYGRTGHVFGQTRVKVNRGKPRDVRNVRERIRTVLRASECEWAATHTFRRTVASRMDAKGVGLAEIANQLGHANIATTARYLGRKDVPTLAAEVMTLPTRTVERHLQAV